ncbi:MAG: hypothetical protein FJY28_00490 [Betaproteobacteria bacterium]|nr:hypothetical protein [Betaproteobacteria bacterium]
MHLQFLEFDRSEDAEGVVCWDALAQPSAEFTQALLEEVAQVLAWAHRFDTEGPGPLENGANWDFDLQITWLQEGAPPVVAQPRFVPGTGQLTVQPEYQAKQGVALSLTLSGTPNFVHAFCERFALT